MRVFVGREFLRSSVLLEAPAFGWRYALGVSFDCAQGVPDGVRIHDVQPDSTKGSVEEVSLGLIRLQDQSVGFAVG
jgi:hypothetical protein